MKLPHEATPPPQREPTKGSFSIGNIIVPPLQIKKNKTLHLYHILFYVGIAVFYVLFCFDHIHVKAHSVISDTSFIVFLFGASLMFMSDITLLSDDDANTLHPISNTWQCVF